MEHAKMPPEPETVNIATSLLADAFGGSVYLGKGEDLGGSPRSRVYRFAVVDGPATMPASVIVKQAHSTTDAVFDPDSPRMPAWTLFNDWAALQFLSQAVPDGAPVPRFYAGDRTRGLFIMEDLGRGERLDHLLLGNDPGAAETALVEFAALHGRLHALTIGKQDDYLRIRQSLGPVEEESEYFRYAWLASTLDQTASVLDIAPATGIAADLAELTSALLHPGPFLAFIQSDSCPDNCVRVDASMRLLDFEGARFTHALLEGVYGRVPFPTCWCVYRLPEHIPLHMEKAYRAELVHGCPAAADDTLFYRAVVEACAFWMLDLYKFFPLSTLLEKDYQIVTSTVRQRLLLRSAIFARLSEEFGHLEALGATVRTIAAKLSPLWPEAVDIPYYPAFQRVISTSEARTVSIGSTGTNGTRNARRRSGCVRRSTSTPIATSTNAVSVPMFVSSATTSIGVRPASSATKMPTMILDRYGV